MGFLLDALSEHRILTLPGQPLAGPAPFGLAHLERLANHFGAVVPHPSNLRPAEDARVRGLAGLEVVEAWSSRARGAVLFEDDGTSVVHITQYDQM